MLPTSHFQASFLPLSTCYANLLAGIPRITYHWLPSCFTSSPPHPTIGCSSRSSSWSVLSSSSMVPAYLFRIIVWSNFAPRTTLGQETQTSNDRFEYCHLSYLSSLRMCSHLHNWQHAPGSLWPLSRSNLHLQTCGIPSRCRSESSVYTI
jgi:hypothetical protein